MKTLVKSLAALALATSLLSSCNHEEAVAPIPVTQTETKRTTEVSSSFVEDLTLYYYDKEVKLYEATRQAGNGNVSYKIFQPEAYNGSDWVAVAFTAQGGSQFETLYYEVLVDMRWESVERVLHAEADGQSLTEMNLVLLLGNW